MTTLTLQIENPSILAHLKEVLKALNGVRIVDADASQSVYSDVEDVPNATTIAAMQEAKSGKDAGVISVDSLDSFIASMQQA